MDCDVIARCDIAELFAQANPRYAVQVVQHRYSPRPEDKFLGQKQTIYDRKNWSSVVLFNNRACRALTLEAIHNQSGLDLHQFRWLADPQIGSLSADWNHLVGEYEPNPNAKIVHFTRGTPCFPEYRECEFADEWRAELADMLIPEAA